MNNYQKTAVVFLMAFCLFHCRLFAQPDPAPLCSNDSLKATACFVSGLRNYEWGSYSAAIELFSNALFFNPNYKNGHYYRGLAYLGARIDSFALYDIMISVTTEERFAKVLNIGWKAEQINNDFKSDVWNFNLAIQLDSLHTDSLNFYSLCREQVLSTILAFEKFLVSKKQDQPLNSKELP